MVMVMVMFRVRFRRRVRVRVCPDRQNLGWGRRHHGQHTEALQYV